MPSTSSRQLPAPSLLGVALASGLVLGLEVLLTRVLSFTVQTAFIHLVLAVAMAGFGIAGTVVALRGVPASAEVRDLALGRASLAFAVSTVVCFAAFARLAPLVAGSFWWAFGVSALLLGPFVSGGLVVTLALATAGERVGRVYAADLFGSALGCLVPMAVLHPLGGERLVALLALGALVPAAVFFRERRRLVSAPFLGALALTGAAVALPQAAFPFRGEAWSQVSVLRQVSAREGYRMTSAFTRWNAVGRVEVFDFADVPGGPAPYPYRFYAQDDTAGALVVRWDGRDKNSGEPASAGSPIPALCTDSVWAQGYYRPRQRVLIIGVGGGLDVQCALYNAAAEVDAVEINPGVFENLRGPSFEYTGRLADIAKLRLHLRDGRSFAHGAPGGSYDLVQLSGVDTKHLLASGSLALAENLLYTEEALGDYLRLLSPEGTLSMIYFHEPLALRLLSTVLVALERHGAAEPLKHVVMHRNGSMYGLLVKRHPFDAAELADYRRGTLAQGRRFAGARVAIFEPFELLVDRPYAPLWAPDAPAAPELRAFTTAVTAGRWRDFAARYPADIHPVSDDRPFFFDIFRYSGVGVLGLPHLRAGLGALLGVLGASFLLSLAPLWRLRRQLRSAELSAVSGYFSLVGLAFLAVEIWLIHRLAMWMGHQTAAFAVVLASLLVATGLGAAFGPRLIAPLLARTRWAMLLLLVALLALGLGLGPLVEATWQAPAAVKLALAGLVSFTPGVLMGVPFPAGLEWLGRRAPEALPWAIALNFFASVVGSLLVIPLTMLWGYSALLVVAAVLYGVVAVLGMRLLAVGSEGAP